MYLFINNDKIVIYKNDIINIFYNNKILYKIAQKGNNNYFNKNTIINLANDEISLLLTNMAVSDPTMMYGLLYKCISQNESYTLCIVNKKYNIETLLFTYTNEALNSQK